MNRYEKGKIYKIVDIGYNKCYIGSTCETLSRRMERHRMKYKSYLRGLTDNTRSFVLFDEYGIENCKIELIENYSCETKMELLKREGHHIKNNECINKIASGRTNAEWRKDNYEHYIAMKREYWNNTKDYHNAQKKEFAKNNPDIIKERSQKNYQKFKEKLAEKHLCGCGVYYTHGHRARHHKCQKHQKWLKEQEEQPEQEPQVEEQK